MVPNYVQSQCSSALKQLERLFGRECLVTLLVRNPTIENDIFVITTDDLGEAGLAMLLAEQAELERQCEGEPE